MKQALSLTLALLTNILLFGQLRYEVTLLDSTVLHPTKLEVKEPFIGRAWLSLDGQRYEFNNLLSYRTSNTYYRVEQIEDWDFPQIYKLEKPGKKLDLYSQEQWTSTPIYTANRGFVGGGFSQKVKVWYFAAGSDPVNKINIQSVSIQLKYDPVAMAAVKKAKKTRNTGIWMSVGGVGLFAAGVAITNDRIAKENKKPAEERSKNPFKVVSPLGIVGLAFIPGFAYVKKAKERKLLEAIDIYNR